MFYRCGFFFFLFFRRLLSEVTEEFQANLDTYSLMTAIWNIWSELPGIYPPWTGGKTRFLGPTLNLDQTYLCNETWHQQSGKKLSIYWDFRTCPQIGWTSVHKPLRTSGKFFFRQLPKFSHWEYSASCIAWTLYNRQQADFVTCYIVARAYSLEQQNAWRAHVGLCRAFRLALIVIVAVLKLWIIEIQISCEQFFSI